MGKAQDQLPKEPNVLNVVLGNLLIKPWYPSFYAEDLVGKVVDRLYVCQACFRYSRELMPYLAHMVRCFSTEQSWASLSTRADAYSCSSRKFAHRRNDLRRAI